MSRHLIVILWLVLYLATQGRADERPADFEQFWQRATVRLQGWPAQPRWSQHSLSFAGPGLLPCRVRCRLGSEQSLPPVLFITDRQEDILQPSDSCNWVLLEAEVARSTQDMPASDPTVDPLYDTILLTRRIVGLMIDASLPAQVRVGLVGEGRGGAAALAAAALYPELVAFVAAYSPEVMASSPYLQARHFAPDVKCPVLLAHASRVEQVEADSMIAVFEELNCLKEMVPLNDLRRSGKNVSTQWSELWRGWANGLLLPHIAVKE